MRSTISKLDRIRDASSRTVREATTDQIAPLRHRILLNFEGQADGVTPDAVLDGILDQVPAVSSPPARPGRAWLGRR